MFFSVCVCHLEIFVVPYVWILFRENEVPITCSLSLSLSVVFMYFSHAIYTWIEEEKSLSPMFISFENVHFHSSKT